jgi:hypothetical protein
MVDTISSLGPYFGDHSMVNFNFNLKSPPPLPLPLQPNQIIKRKWTHYSKTSLCNKLFAVNWDIGINDVQKEWNIFENILVIIV